MGPLPTLLPVAPRKRLGDGAVVRFSEGCEDLQGRRHDHGCQPALKKSTTARGELLEMMDSSVKSSKKFPQLEAGQTGGVYTVPDTKSQCGSPLAVFKSGAEEGFQRRGIPPGGGALREEAAYVLDRLSGSPAGVPVTARAEVPGCVLDGSPATPESSGSDFARGISSGSVQEFVRDVAGASEDFGMPRDLAGAAGVVSVLAVQEIASLDLRLCNTDRHAGNLLFKRQPPSSAGGAFRPVPIDHGCALPRWWAVGEASFEAWAGWPQVNAPCLPEVLATVEAAYRGRGEALAALAGIGLEPAARATYAIALALLREGTVRHGLSLGAVARLLGRDPCDPGEPSWLERRMEECALELGAGWRWARTARGDLVPEAPENPAAWPPAGLVERLEGAFRSDLLRAAGRRAGAPSLSALRAGRGPSLEAQDRAM